MTVAGKDRKQTLVFLGMLLLSLAVCIGVGAYFWMMSHPAQENLGYSLYPNPSESFGWRHRVDGVERVPQFDELGYLPSFPVEGEVCVVEASRVMTEARREGILRFIDFTGVQVFLDDKLLYTDFPEGDNRFGTTLPWGVELASAQEPRMERYVPLPQDYLGKTLTVVSYATVYGGMGGGCYPELYESSLLQGGFVPMSVLPVAAAAVAAVLGLLLLVLFLFRLWSASADWPSLLLVLFSFLSMVVFSGESFPVSLAMPGGGTPDVVYFVKSVAIDALLFYFATQMRKYHGLLLAAAAVAHMLLHTAALAIPDQVFTLAQSAALPLLLLTALVLMALEYRQQALFRLLLCALIPLGLVFAVLVLISERGANANGVYLAFTTALWGGNWMPLGLILSTVLSLLSALLLLVRFIRTQVRERLEYRAHQIETIYQRENTENLALALDEAKSARHEYRHHLETLRGLVDAEGQPRAAEYLDSVITQEHREPHVQFSQHPVVNMAVSTLYRRARRLGIEVKSSVTVPEHIAVADADLSLMLRNMIDNAFEAIARMPEGETPFIHLKAGIVDGHIFYLGCENSYAGAPCQSGALPPTTKADPENHGFGLAAIRRTAQAYKGFLVLSGDGAVFKAQVRLSLPQ